MSKDMDDPTPNYERIGRAVVQLGRLLNVQPEAGFALQGMSIRGPQYKDGEYLATLRATNAEGDRFVAFHGAFELGGLLRGVEARIRADQMTWKPDEYVR
jgi:hypothetical protein